MTSPISKNSGNRTRTGCSTNLKMSLYLHFSWCKTSFRGTTTVKNKTRRWGTGWSRAIRRKEEIIWIYCSDLIIFFTIKQTNLCNSWLLTLKRLLSNLQLHRCKDRYFDFTHFPYSYNNFTLYGCERVAKWNRKSISNMEEYDAFALTSYSFAIRKTNNFFSLTTLLLSLAIITTSILLNYSTISHLWLSVPELPVLSSQCVAYPQSPMTSTLVCFKPSDDVNATLGATLLDSNYKTIPTTILSESQVYASDPLLASQIGTDFACIDIAGLQLTPTN